jgi:hypothetical protein
MSVNPALPINSLHSSDVRNVAFAMVRAMNSTNSVGERVLVYVPSLRSMYPPGFATNTYSRPLLRIVEERCDGLTNDDVEYAILEG